MSEEELNIKYICNKTLLDEKDELVPIILKMLSEAYIKGLKQGKFDKEMEMLELQSVIDKAIEYIESSKSKTSYDNMLTWVEELYLDDDRCKELLEILRSKNEGI